MGLSAETKKRMEEEYKISEKVGDMQDLRDEVIEDLNAIQRIEKMGVVKTINKDGLEKTIEELIQIKKEGIANMTIMINEELDKLPKVRVTTKTYRIIED